MADVIHPPTILRKDLVTRLRGPMKYVVNKNEDGSFTAKLDKHEEVTGKGHDERSAMYAAQKALTELVQKKGLMALKGKDLQQ